MASNKDKKIRSTRTKVSAVDFVKIWQSSESLDEANKKLGVLSNTAQSRAFRYRGLGIELKKFDRKPKLNVEELKELAASLR